MVGMMRREGWARNMTDEVKTFAETTSQRVSDQAKEHRLLPEPSEDQLKEGCDMVRAALSKNHSGCRMEDGLEEE